MGVRTASKTERHLASDIGIVGNAVPDIASAPASTKNRISNTPSWPKKRTAFLASSKLLDGLGKATFEATSRVDVKRSSPTASVDGKARSP